MADLTINFGFVTNAQSGDTKQREIGAMTNSFARMMVNDIAYNIATYSSQQAHKTLAQSVRKVVDDQISNMAMTIGNSLSITERALGPQGVMSIHGISTEMGTSLSRTAEARGWRNDAYNWNRKQTGIKWGKRNKRYLDWKSSQGKSRNWWELKGGLADYLRDPKTYTQSFGPVRVVFDRPKNQEAARARLGSAARLTASGITGPVTAEYEVGKIRVMALGNITPQDLPSLRSENPADAKPLGRDSGLARYLRNEEQAVKLTRFIPQIGHMRHVLEPFMSFYLTRAIPNAVWRRIEQQPIRLDAGAGRTR